MRGEGRPSLRSVDSECQGRAIEPRKIIAGVLALVRRGGRADTPQWPGVLGPAGVEEQGQGTRGVPGNLGDPSVSTDNSGSGARTTKAPMPSIARRRPLGANGPTQGWYRQAKATKCGERDGRESERPIVPTKRGNHSEGPGGGKGAPCHETVGGKHGGCIGTRGRVHETTTDRGTRATKSGDGIHISGLPHRHRLAERGVRPHSQRRRGGRGRTDGEDYAANLEGNLSRCWNRAKSGTYQAPPVRRVHIPKAGSATETRPLGIPTFEDKVLQRAVVMVLEAIYEQDFKDCSYGFRPGRSAHQALDDLWKQTMAMGGGWIVDVDIRKFFDTIDHGHLRDFLKRRMRDGVLLRLIGKWLNAGVLEDGCLTHPEKGSPQGGVISPILSNIFLHYVLDEWFEREVQPRLKGRSFLIRYADDFVMGFSCEEDARRVMDVLPKRFGKYGLTIHPDKTRLVPFERPGPDRGWGDLGIEDTTRDFRPAGVHALLGTLAATGTGW